jgi:hypothetical protein
MAKLLVARGISALLGLAVVAVAVFAIKGFVGDKVDEATSAASGPTEISDAASLYRQDNFQKALDALVDRTGQDPELLKVAVQPHLAEFQVKQGERAEGYRYFAGNGDMAELEVKIIGGGSIEGQQFPMVDAGVTERLATAVAGRDGLHATNMTLERPITGGPPRWSVNAESDDRTGIVFQAKPDGSGLADPTAF